MFSAYGLPMSEIFVCSQNKEILEQKQQGYNEDIIGYKEKQFWYCTFGESKISNKFLNYNV